MIESSGGNRPINIGSLLLDVNREEILPEVIGSGEKNLLAKNHICKITQEGSCGILPIVGIKVAAIGRIWGILAATGAGFASVYKKLKIVVQGNKVKLDGKLEISKIEWNIELQTATFEKFPDFFQGVPLPEGMGEKIIKKSKKNVLDRRKSKKWEKDFPIVLNRKKYKFHDSGSRMSLFEFSIHKRKGEEKSFLTYGKMGEQGVIINHLNKERVTGGGKYLVKKFIKDNPDKEIYTIPIPTAEGYFKGFSFQRINNGDYYKLIK